MAKRRWHAPSDTLIFFPGTNNGGWQKKWKRKKRTWQTLILTSSFPSFHFRQPQFMLIFVYIAFRIFETYYLVILGFVLEVGTQYGSTAAVGS